MAAKVSAKRKGASTWRAKTSTPHAKMIVSRHLPSPPPPTTTKSIFFFPLWSYPPPGLSTSRFNLCGPGRRVPDFRFVLPAGGPRRVGRRGVGVPAQDEARGVRRSLRLRRSRFRRIWYVQHPSQFMAPSSCMQSRPKFVGGGGGVAQYRLNITERNQRKSGICAEGC